MTTSSIRSARFDRAACLQGESIAPVQFSLRDAYADLSSVDLLLQAVGRGAYDEGYDLNFDNQLDRNDILFWANQIEQTYIGDSNLDGQFNSSDLVHLFDRGTYGLENIDATRADGDWNGDGIFDSSDFVFAMLHGGYEQGARHSVAASVPEPAGSLPWFAMLMMTLTGLLRRRV